MAKRRKKGPRKVKSIWNMICPACQTTTARGETIVKFQGDWICTQCFDRLGSKKPVVQSSYFDAVPVRSGTRFRTYDHDVFKT